MKASECKCVECGRQAVAFFPVFDPDIPSYPYCRECLDKAKMELAVALWGNDEQMLTIAKNVIKYGKNNQEGRNTHEAD